MTLLDTQHPAPTAYGTPRLLAGVLEGRRADLVRHREVHGPRPDREQTGLVADAAAVGLLGRGGAAFPVATKLRALPRSAECHVLVNGSEGEPASQKDRTLMRLAPHLVLDGALGVARALDTRRVTVVVHDRRAADSLQLAIGERDDAGGIRVVAGRGGFVSGEVQAVVRSLNGGPAAPPGRRFLPSDRGVGGRPTFASNVETFAQLALLLSLGPAGFASVGAPGEPGTTLLTLLGDVPAPGVVEVPTGLPLGELLPGQDASPRPVLVGGYHGTWVRDVRGLRVERAALRQAGVPLNAGVIARLPGETCALAEIAAVASWLAGQSAGQCGPCLFGLPALAADVHALLGGADAWPALSRRLGHLPGRGACAHPDGSALFLSSALQVLEDEVATHRRHGTCGRAWFGVLPTGTGAVRGRA